MENKEKELIDNELVRNLNSIFEKEYFLFTLCKYTTDYKNYTTIAGLTFIPTKQSIHTIRRTVNSSEDIYKEVTKEFNRSLLQHMLFGLPTGGKVIDMDGREIMTFADCKIYIINDDKR